MVRNTFRAKAGLSSSESQDESPAASQKGGVNNGGASPRRGRSAGAAKSDGDGTSKTPLRKRKGVSSSQESQRSSSRERKMRKCTVCKDCDDGPGDAGGDVDVQVQVIDQQEDELLDYEDDSENLGENPSGDEQLDVVESCGESDQSMQHSDEANVNQNARTKGSAVKSKAVHKDTPKPKGRPKKIVFSDEETNSGRADPIISNEPPASDVEQSLRTVLSSEAALARVMKECAPVFAQAMQQAQGSLSSQVVQVSVPQPSTSAAPYNPSPLQALEKTGEIDANMRELNLSDRELLPLSNDSEATVYTRACRRADLTEVDPRSDSDNLPSDESINVSSGDETLNTGTMISVTNTVNEFIADQHRRVSHEEYKQRQTDPEIEQRNRARGRADAIVKEAENAKASLIKPPGELPLPVQFASGEIRRVDPDDGFGDGTGPSVAAQATVPQANSAHSSKADPDPKYTEDRFRHAFRIDQKHNSLTSGISKDLKTRIQMGQYINLQRLLPRDRIDPTDDHDRYRMLHKDGYSYVVDDKEKGNRETGLPINSLLRWDQAFRTYYGIYLEANPKKATEVVQYVSTIHKFAASYPWERVYNYDILFRKIFNDDPDREWDIINYQYFMEELGDKFAQAGSSHGSGPLSPPGVSAGVKREACWRFNKFGKCKWGKKCLTGDHKCSICGMFNHPQFKCRLRKHGDRDSTKGGFKTSPKH